MVVVVVNGGSGGVGLVATGVGCRGVSGDERGPEGSTEAEQESQIAPGRVRQKFLAWLALAVCCSVLLLLRCVWKMEGGGRDGAGEGVFGGRRELYCLLRAAVLIGTRVVDDWRGLGGDEARVSYGERRASVCVFGRK